MDTSRFVETGSNSFFGEYLYDLVVPPNHFLRHLNQIIDWDRFTRKLLKLYKGGGMVGRPPFDPAMILKMELIAYLYKLTERQVEVYVNENMPAKYFVGLAADQSAPDHSSHHPSDWNSSAHSLTPKPQEGARIQAAIEDKHGRNWKP